MNEWLRELGYWRLGTGKSAKGVLVLGLKILIFFLTEGLSLRWDITG